MTSDLNPTPQRYCVKCGHAAHGGRCPVLMFYDRGPNSPQGNRYCDCDCIDGAQANPTPLSPERAEGWWDQNAVQCGNCSVEIVTRNGSIPNNNGLSDTQGSEDEHLCGRCAGVQMYTYQDQLEDKARIPTPERAEPVGWRYKFLVNKHVSGPPLLGEISMLDEDRQAVWGIPGAWRYLDGPGKPTMDWVCEAEPLYSTTRILTPERAKEIADRLEEIAYGIEYSFYFKRAKELRAIAKELRDGK